MEYLKLLLGFFRLRGNVKKSRARIEAIREEKLRRMLEHAYEHSPYHRRQFQDAGIMKSHLRTLPLSAFPTMDKAALLEHFDELVTAPDLHQADLRRFDADDTERGSVYLNKYHVVHSSGSTGKPGYFVYDEAAWGQMLLGVIRGALWNMSASKIFRLLMKGPRIVYIAATDGRYGGAMAVGDGVDGLRAQQLFLDIKTPLKEWIENIRAFKPNIIIGYPSAIKILGELVAAGDVQVDLLRIISCGEPLGASLRDFFEKTFKATVVNFYGASESLALGVETDRAQGMFLFDDLNYIEVEGDAIYLTSLYNFVQPIIRYHISDRLTLQDPNGKFPFTRVESLQGRGEDLLWFEDWDGRRDFLHPLAIEGFCIEGLLDYQFRQTGRDSFEMLTEISDHRLKGAVEEEMRRQMAGILQSKHLDYVRFELRFAERILPDSRTGKKKLIAPPMRSEGLAV